MTRRLAAAPLALAATLVLATAALAGGWATATLDPGTAGPTAGTPTTIGFMVLQHGQTPNSTLAVVVHASGGNGGAISANATAQGAEGHYVATLTFPTDGAWRITWSSELDMAGSSATLNVTPVAAVPVAPVSSPTPVTTSSPVNTIAVLAVALVLIVTIVAGAVALRRRRGRASVPSAG